ncbi:MAG: small, acid-soluble spore protein, alpha/beta type [Lachnospiraceae bacterium]|nr:small, acid-soluble spore protein, alpha/beta type [Lachnospiraceae bacterium]
MKNEKKIEITCLEDIKKLPQKEQLKYEIANELGLFEKVISQGWGTLSSKESGKIGGLLANKQRKGK